MYNEKRFSSSIAAIFIFILSYTNLAFLTSIYYASLHLLILPII